MSIFQAAGKETGFIPICGTVNELAFKQTLVKFQGEWRLYINTSMLKDSPKHVGEILAISVQFDPEPRIIPVHPKLAQALQENPQAQAVFDALPPSRRKEIVRYIARLKNEASIEKNITRAIGFLMGKNRFVGRDTP